MPKAVLKNGVIYPLEPLPAEWSDGQELEVCESSDDMVDVDAWFAEMERLCADITPEEDARLAAAIADVRKKSKELTRLRGQPS